MGIDLYYMPGSSQCFAIQLTAKALGIELNLIETNVIKKEQMTPEFFKINPQQSIPTLVDNGFSVWETRAIMAYLANKYGKEGQLYPKDPQARAVVDQRMYFDIGTLHKSSHDYFLPQWMEKLPGEPAKLEKLHEALGFVNTFLEGNKWIAGPNITLADIIIATTINNIIVVGGVDVSKYQNLTRWHADCKKDIGGYNDMVDKQSAALKSWLKLLMEN